jgi:glycosyltransferase involved in cell wall biosynthesis
MLTSGCVSGTRILTAAGLVPVEALVEGELVATHGGRLVSVRRVNRHRFDLRHHPQPLNTRPVRIAASSIADGIPHRDLVLAPNQTVDIAGFKIPCGLLVNGATVTRVTPDDCLTYFAMEPDRSEALFAEGITIYCLLKAEDRSQAVPSDDELELARAHLSLRASQMGFTTTGDPGLHIAAKDRLLWPDRQDSRRYRFRLPPGVSEFRLVSRRFVPNERQPFAGDDRQLGIPLARLQLDDGQHQHEIDLDDTAHAGLHLPQQLHGATWRWTTGDAQLRCPELPRSALLSVDLAPIAGQYWVSSDSHPSAKPTGTRRSASVGSVVFISGEPHTPGHTYRVLRPVSALQRLDIAATWLRVDEVPMHLAEIAAASTLIIWRAPCGHEISLAMETARRAGAKVVLDIDDLMIEPRLARTDVIDGIRSNKYDEADVRALYAGIRETLRQADACICTTAEIATHALGMYRPAYVVPNAFDPETLQASRAAVRSRQQVEPSNIVRLGYAGGTRTHQKDFAVVAPALGKLLRERPNCRLVLFREPDGGLPLIDVREFPGISARAGQIEWRDMVELDALPAEIARFDINLAPLDTGNLFCEAKSELKFFEAALVDVCTVASATRPFMRAIRDGETGFLARSSREWLAILRRLVDDGPLRHRVGAAAFHDVLWTFGPEAQADRMAAAITQLHAGRDAARAFECELHRMQMPRPSLPRVPQHEVLHVQDRGQDAAASVVIPLYNYAHFIRDALDSVWHQTLQPLDLVVVDDRSTDQSVAVAMDWIKRNGDRFNRVIVLQNLVNSELGLTRNVGFAAAETPYVFLLDADNRLFPHCLEFCLHAVQESGAGFVYPMVQQFGDTTELMNHEPFTGMRFAGGNYVDAMALVGKSTWAAVGGFDHVQFGWEDFDFWCRCVERGLWGQGLDIVLAEYRVHSGSMLRTRTDHKSNKGKLVADLQKRHPWLMVDQVIMTDERVSKLDKIRSKSGRPRKSMKAISPALLRG